MLRERGKQERRNSVLRAAEALIRKTGSVDFSLNELAEEAIVSVGTIYNLIGSKATVLYALLNLSLDQIDTTTDPPSDGLSPMELALLASERAASIFENDPVFLRPLYRYVLGVPEPEHRHAFMARAFNFWKNRLSVLKDASLLDADITLDDMAREHQIYFAGLLDQWVHGEIPNEHIKLYARYSGAMRLLSIADAETSKWLRAEMRAAKRGLGRARGR